MSDTEANNLHQLFDLLEEERVAIKSGSFSEFPLLTAKIAGLVDQVLQASEFLDPLTFEKLRNTARRNQRLLDAAAQGIKAAKARGVEIRGRALNMKTYDDNGQRSLMTPITRGFEHRS